jgi:hypothetical protein
MNSLPQPYWIIYLSELLLLDMNMNDSNFIQGEIVQRYGCLFHF